MSVESLNAAERETIVNASDDDELVHVWTAQRRYITRMRRDPQFTEVKSGTYGLTEWAEFTIPADQWSPTGVKRRRNMTTSARNEARARLLALRENPGA